MFDFDGDDLIDVLKGLNVQLDAINPNVIRGWFDNDDKDIKDMLNWMCTSLSDCNYVSAQEEIEFEEIESLSGMEYEKQMSSLQTDYPGILDFEDNKEELEFLEDEYELFESEKERTDNLVNIFEDLNHKITSELSNLTTKHVQTKLQSTEMQEKCYKLSLKMDDLNEDLLEKLNRYGTNLQDFVFNEYPNFLNSMQVQDFQESLDQVSHLLNVLANNNFTKSLKISDLDSQSLDVSNCDDTMKNELCDLRERIFQTYQNYLANKFEGEKLCEIQNYFKKKDVHTVLNLTKSIYMQANVDAKEQQKRLMCEMLIPICGKYADQCINQPKLRYQRQELKDFENRLKNITDLLNVVTKLLAYYIVILNLYKEEKKDIDMSEKFFRKIVDYVTKELENCLHRTKKMEEIIGEAQVYNNKPLKDKCSLIKSIGRVLTNTDCNSSGSILEAVCNFKKELDSLQEQIFVNDFYDQRKLAKEMNKNMDVLYRFLVCGPTHRIICIPPNLYNACKDLNNLIKNQSKAIQNAVNISGNMKRVKQNKWENYRRLLWIYFMKDPQKMMLILEQAKDEFRNKQITN